jgi:hypothetical protein
MRKINDIEREAHKNVRPPWFGITRILELKMRRPDFRSRWRIAGILRLIETTGWKFAVAKSQKTANKGAGSKSFAYAIPRPAIFEGNAKELQLLHPGLYRKIAQFHALLGDSGNVVLTARSPREQIPGTLGLLSHTMAGFLIAGSGTKGAVRAFSFTSPCSRLGDRRACRQARPSLWTTAAPRSHVA